MIKKQISITCVFLLALTFSIPVVFGQQHESSLSKYNKSEAEHADNETGPARLTLDYGKILTGGNANGGSCDESCS